MQRFQRGDCDGRAIARYELNPAERLTHEHNEITTAQEFLGLEADGNVGPATLKAIADWEAANDADFYAAVFDEPSPSPQIDPKDVAVDADDLLIGGRIAGVPHISQWDYPNIEIVPGKSVRQIGCLSCCCDIIYSFHIDGDLNIESFVRNLKAFDGYDPAGNIQWGAVEKVTGLAHCRDVGTAIGKTVIDNGSPIIVCVRTKKGGTHFIVGIGYDANGFHCHDVGSWRGNQYAHPNRVPGPGDPPGQTFVEYGDVIRVDTLTEEVVRMS